MFHSPIFVVVFNYLWQRSGSFFNRWNNLHDNLFYEKGKKEKLIANGKYIYADIVDIDVNVYQKVQIDRISMNPYFIVCKYVEANGKEYLFKSKSLLYNPSALITEKQLKVYVDLKNPKKYYVDTSSILPDSAVLHKFKFDSRGKERALLKEGNYINAVTCGVELVGRIKVNSIVKPMFLKVTDSLSEQFKTPVDEKTEHLWGIQCYADMMHRMGKYIFLHPEGSGGNLKEIIREKMSEYIIVEKL